MPSSSQMPPPRLPGDGSDGRDGAVHDNREQQQLKEFEELQLQLERERMLRNELKKKNVQLQNQVSELREVQSRDRETEQEVELHYQACLLYTSPSPRDRG